ncbi:MAG: response regulator [Oscillospiraceae bacterium]|nr:response regulator [Oscillospiraceae bacterium]
MTAICVDDEPLVLQLTLSLFRDLPGFQVVEGFAGPLEALDWLENHTPDIALLDIDMPGMNGLELARRIRDMHPDTAVIFLTGYSEYALDAFQLHASGYLMKPINREKLASEVEYALSGRNRGKASNVFAKTFGNFDLLVDGRPLVFKRSKSKELLAYLVDRHGGNVSRPEAFAVLWEDTFYDRAMQKQMDVVIRSLRSTLEEAGVGEIFEIQSGWMRILPERMDSDLFRFLDGNREAIQEYRGEYMSAYSWASQTEAYLDRILQEQS